ncbi:MAG: YitT family protein [Bacteroidales bacterium]|nr:YitT family protein [Bacteroidales bacterium]
MSNRLSKYNSMLVNSKDYLMIILGLLCYSLGFSAFILPHKVVIGGLAGVGTLVYFATDGFIPVAVTQFVCNLLLLACAYKLVGRQFVLRTLFGVIVVALGIGSTEGFFMGLGHPLVPDRVVSIVLGGILCGVGVGTSFIHNGSSGGTDIVAAMVSKFSNVSVGRTMIYVDFFIVSLSILLPFEGTWGERIEARVPTIVYGITVTFVVSYVCDQIINGNRRATQFYIFSPKWREIADKILSEANRGCTIIDGQGWFTKHDVKIVMVYCRKIESVTIFRIIKSIDNDAFVSQGNVNGVYGKGFDHVKIKMKKAEKSAGKQ